MSALETAPPKSFGPYDVERVLGRGAMGTVYLARDRRIGRRVALKTITITPQQLDDTTTSPKEFYSRLQREAEVSGSLHHPNIVTLYEAGYEDDRISYLAMEYVEGETLLALMHEAAPVPLPLETTLRIMEDVLRGLAHAHERGIVHRDIKPANVLVTNDGTAKIADFGIARPQNSSITAAGALMGTPNYMSPEQVQGQTLTPKADVFSAGVMMYEMLTTDRPFVAGDLTSILHNILRQPVRHPCEVNAIVPRNVGDLVATMVSKKPEERPASAEVLQEIERLRATALPTPKRRREPTTAIAISAAAVLVLIALAIGIVRSRHVAKPVAEIAPAQLREFDEKRRALDRAAEAYSAGRYQESLDRYSAYLQKYPNSAAAIEGRDRSKEALDRETKAATEDPQSKAAAKQRNNKKKKDEDISPSELMSRIKKWFRGK